MEVNISFVKLLVFLKLQFSNSKLVVNGIWLFLIFHFAIFVHSQDSINVDSLSYKLNNVPVLSITNLSTETLKFFNFNQKIELPASTKYITINYSISDQENNKVEFSYKLEPFDKEWQKAGTEKTARYSNLPHGNYAFYAKAVIGTTGKSIMGPTISFTIKPAFFETILFKIIILVLFISFIRLIYILRIKTIKKQKELLEIEVKERTAEIISQKESIEKNLLKLEKQQAEIDLKNEEILIANSNIEQAYLNLRLLSDLGKEITSYLDIGHIIHAVYQNISSQMDSDILAIGLYNAADKTIKFVSPYYRGNKLDEIILPIANSGCLINYSLINGIEIISNDIEADYPELTSTFPKISTFKAITSLIAIPIRSKNKAIGIITVQSFRRNSYSEYHLNLLQNLAVYIGIAIENTNTYQKINQQKEELQRVNASKDKMFSIIGHDLRNPVGTLKEFFDFLIESPALSDTEKTREILKTMRQSLGTTYTLLDNLLLWARNQRGLIEFHPEPFDIYLPVENCVSLVNESIKIKKVKISTNIESTGKVFADQTMITTILRNLISNAVKFTPAHGEIIISIKNKLQKFPNGLDEVVEIKIIDNGIGIRDEDIQRILQPNDMFSTPGTENEQGSGLGISICIDFLSKHDKKLNIERNDGLDGTPPTGTTFSFQLDKA